MSQRTLFVALMAAASVWSPAQAQLPVYEGFELQARTNLIVNDEGWNLPPGSSFNSISADINDGGQVTFPVQVVTDPDDPTIAGVGVWHGLHGAGAIAHRHDAASGDEIYISSAASINALGEVAYVTHAGLSDYRMWLYDPVAGSASQVGLLPLTPSGYSSVSLSDSRVIGYQGLFASGRGFASTAAFAVPADSVSHLYDNSIDPGSPHNYLYTPAMNNQRLIAGKVNVGTGSDFSRAEIRLFASDGSSTRVVADNVLDPGSPFDRFDNGLAINDAGAVAVMVRLAAGSVRAVYRFDHQGATEIAHVGGGPILEIDFFAPAINDDGLVAFRARDAVGQAVYVGDGTTLQRVIGKGDAVQTDLGAAQIGQHDSSPVFAGAPGMNGRGDIVVVAGLHPDGNNQVEWGSGVIVAWASGEDTIFADGFETP